MREYVLDPSRTMSGSHYGTKAQRLQQALARAPQLGDRVSTAKLPSIRNSEDAVRIGQKLTPNQYYVLEGAKRSDQRMFDVLEFDRRKYSDKPELAAYIAQLRADFAFQMQMIREAQGCAPGVTLAALAAAKDVTME